MKKLLKKRGAIVSLVVLLTVSVFVWTEYRSSSIETIISSNVEALTNDNGANDLTPLQGDGHYVYTANNVTYFIGFSNRYEKSVLRAGCVDMPGVCDTSAKISSTNTKAGWIAWAEPILKAVGLGLQILKLVK